MSSTVLESCTVSVFIPGKKYGEDVDQQLSFPIQCSFWALTDASQRSGRAECAILGTAVSLSPLLLITLLGYVLAGIRGRSTCAVHLVY